MPRATATGRMREWTACLVVNLKGDTIQRHPCRSHSGFSLVPCFLWGLGVVHDMCMHALPFLPNWCEWNHRVDGPATSVFTAAMVTGTARPHPSRTAVVLCTAGLNNPSTPPPRSNKHRPGLARSSLLISVCSRRRPSAIIIIGIQSRDGQTVS